MNKFEASSSDLTKNQNLVMGALSHANGPLSAYTILDELRAEIPKLTPGEIDEQTSGSQ